ncbi:hypothetical protein J6590_052994 [Homalodisca vitripennis]|nr:hypothetical protein J6590_052994 [Homalodisca vitripennis]
MPAIWAELVLAHFQRLQTRNAAQDFGSVSPAQSAFHYYNSEYVKKRKDLPYAAMHVQGFSDTPVSWLLQEHVYRTDGHNQYTLVLRSDLSYLLFTTVTSPKKIKMKIS